MLGAIGRYVKARTPARPRDYASIRITNDSGSTPSWSIAAAISGLSIAAMTTSMSATSMSTATWVGFWGSTSEVEVGLAAKRIRETAGQATSPVCGSMKLEEGLKWLYTHVPSYSEWNRFLIFWRMGDGVLENVRVDPSHDDNGESVSPMNQMMKMVTPAINAAIRASVPVMCWDSDAPDSDRFCYHGVDNYKCGQQLMETMARVMNNKGTIAVLAGNQTAPNLQERVRGVREDARKYPQMTIKEVYYHAEDPQSAAAKVEQVQTANPDIQGWAMIGGWALLSDAIRKNPLFSGGKIKIVSVDALPECLEYIRQGVAQELLAQGCYQWGHRAVEILYDKSINGPGCVGGADMATLTPVTRANVEDFAKKWDKWLPNRK